MNDLTCVRIGNDNLAPFVRAGDFVFFDGVRTPGRGDVVLLDGGTVRRVGDVVPAGVVGVAVTIGAAL